MVEQKATLLGRDATHPVFGRAALSWVRAIINIKTARIAIVITFTAIAFSLPILFLTNKILAAAIMLIGFVGLFVCLYPQKYVILFLIFRPTLDIFTEYRFAGGLNCASVATILFVVFGGLLLFKRGLGKIRSSRVLVKLNKIFFVYIAISFASIIHSSNFIISIADIMRLTAIIVSLNYAFVYFSDIKGQQTLFNSVICSAVIPLLLGLYQYKFGAGNLLTEGFNRIYGTFYHPNIYAFYLAIMFFLGLHMLRREGIKRNIRFFLCLFIMVVAFELYYTFSRGIWISLALMLCFAFLSFKQSGKMFFIALIIAGLFLTYPKIMERFADLQKPGTYGVNSMEGRILLWKRTAVAIMRHPVIGNGLGMYEEKFAIMSHNDYLRITYETGILGILAYLFFQFSIMSNAVWSWIRATYASMRVRYTTIICLIGVVLIASVTDNLARSMVVILYVFSAVGALIGMRDQEEKGRMA